MKMYLAMSHLLNSCPKHGMLLYTENAILTIEGKKHDVSVSFCQQCMCYYSSSTLLPRNRKLSYKDYPLVSSETIHSTKSKQCTSTDKKQAIISRQPQKVSKQKTQDLKVLEEEPEPVIYLIDDKNYICPFCMGTLVHVLKTLRLRNSIDSKGSLRKIYANECEKCKKIFVLANVYEQIAQGREFSVTIRKISPPQEIEESNLTDNSNNENNRGKMRNASGIPYQTKVNQKNSAMTIKDAIIYVLNAEQHAMTPQEIHKKIIEKGLYVFGAQNPVNVVRNTIEYANENTGYTNHDKVPYFRSERKDDGRKVYSLLTTSTQAVNVQTINISIWNDATERAFQVWLERGHYSQNTVNQYRRAVELIYRRNEALAQKAMIDATSGLDATRKWIVLLGNDSMFVSANRSRHNQFTAALTAFEQFRSLAKNEESESENVSYNNINEISSAINNTSSSLDDIIDFEEGKAGIQRILETHFQTLYGYSNISILWNAAQDTLSMFLNDNAINNADDLWRFLQRAFSYEYTLSNPHIWRNAPNYPQSYVGVIINLARQLGGTVTREQIDDYFACIKQGSPINTAIIRQGQLMFYISRKFILAESVNLSSERRNSIKNSLDKLFACEKVPYIVLRDITDEWFASLPEIKGGHPWTALLLQEVLRLYSSIDYRIIFSGLDGQSLDTLGVAVVPDKSDITTFADIAHCYCFEKGLLTQRMQAEELRLMLRDAGMVEGNELIYNLHKALRDYRFAFTDENRMVKILEK